MTISATTFLRRVLTLDAGLSAAMGALMLLAASPLSSLLGLPPALLKGAGLTLLPFAAFVGWLASRETPPRLGVWAVVLINIFWTVDSFVLLASGRVDPTPLGTAFVAFQAAVVGILAGLEIMGLRRVGRMAVA